MVDSVDVIIQPVCIRFSLFEGEVCYHFCARPGMQLDGMELLMGVDPAKCRSFADANLGFLPVASTVLIKGEKNILVDPGSHHIGFYGLLGKALRDNGIDFTDIDILVVTHWHHDHFSNASMFPGAELIVGAGELDWGGDIYGVTEVKAKTEKMRGITIVTDVHQIYKGVTVVRTPGHSPGSISVIVDHGNDRIAITGDTVMTRKEFYSRKHSRWYTAEQKQQLNRALDRIMEYSPTRVIPGHDQMFDVQAGNFIIS